MNGDKEAPPVLDALKDYKDRIELPAPLPDLTVVGMKYQDYIGFLETKRLRTCVLLVPEPANLHDANAVAAYVTRPIGDSNWMWIKAGYVAKNLTQYIRDRHKIYEATLINKGPHSWEISVSHSREY